MNSANNRFGEASVVGATMPRMLLAVVAVLLAIGCLRLLSFWQHDPLYAYANSYDQVRYTACFDLYPDRPATIPPDNNSPWAPYSDYRFIKTEAPFCYWSSELLFQAVNAAYYGLVEALGGGPSHDVRSIGGLRIAALLAIVLGFVVTAWRRKQPALALGHAAVFAFLFADPGNTLYLNGFYAEWTSLLSAYAMLGLVLLWRNRDATKGMALCIAALAFALSFSKIQHVVLPLALGIVLLILDRCNRRPSSWRAWAMIVGGCIGVVGQGMQLGRGGELMNSIRIHNQTHVVLMGLLPQSSDPAALIEEMGVDPTCLQYIGKRAWQLPGQPELICPGVEEFGRGKQLAILLRHPELGLRLFGNGVLALQPWIAPGIGQVERATNAELPKSVPNLGEWLSEHAGAFYFLLALPFIALLIAVANPRWRNGRAFEYIVLTCTLMVATLGVTILGDGLADTRKQGHLIGNAAIAFAIVLVVAMIQAWRNRERKS